MRDVLLGTAPVFWIHQPEYIIVATAAALLTVVLVRFWRGNRQLLLVLDALGLAFFCVLGAAKAQQVGASHLTVVLMGAMTGTVGGLLRDILAGEVPLILHQDLYATCAVLGAAVFDLLIIAGAPTAVAVWAGLAAALLLRLAAIRWHWGLPVFALRPEH